MMKVAAILGISKHISRIVDSSYLRSQKISFGWRKGENKSSCYLIYAHSKSSWAR